MIQITEEMAHAIFDFLKKLPYEQVANLLIPYQSMVAPQINKTEETSKEIIEESAQS